MCLSPSYTWPSLWRIWYSVSLSGKFYQMSSFGESSAVKHSSRNNSTSFMMYNKKQLSRIYPAGRRVDSSNYNPVDMWNSGCQIGE